MTAVSVAVLAILAGPVLFAAAVAFLGALALRRIVKSMARGGIRPR